MRGLVKQQPAGSELLDWPGGLFKVHRLDHVVVYAQSVTFDNAEPSGAEVSTTIVVTRWCALTREDGERMVYAQGYS